MAVRTLKQEKGELHVMPMCLQKISNQSPLKSGAGKMGPLVVCAILLALVQPASAEDFIFTGIYQGDSNFDTHITGIGFRPAVVIIKGDVGGTAYIKTAEMPGEFSRSLGASSGLELDYIISLDDDGFSLGYGREVNNWGTEYWFIAFREDPGLMATGMYQGDGTIERYISASEFTPEAVLILPDQDFIPRLRVEGMAPGKSLPLVDQSCIDGGITDLTFNGFRVDDDLATNQSLANFYYIAWNNIGSAVHCSKYLGEGNDSLPVTEPGFRPIFLLIKSDLNNDSVLRTKELRNDDQDGALKIDTAGIVDDTILEFNDDGFVVGRRSEVNFYFTDMFYLSFANPTVYSDLNLSLLVDKPAPAEGDTIFTLIQIQNNGPSDPSHIQVQSLLPEGLTYVGHLASSGTYTSGTGDWVLDELLVGEMAALGIQATVDYGTGGQILVQSAAIVAQTPVDLDNSDNQASAEIDVQMADHILVWSDAGQAQSVLPGSAAAEVLDLVTINQGTSSDFLSSITLTNLTVGAGTQADLDAEWESLTLHWDLRGDTQGSSQRSGSFVDGKATFLGLGQVFAPGDTLDVWATAQSSLVARDGAMLVTGVESLAELGFTNNIYTPSTMPLVSGHGLLIDGFVAAQANLVPVESMLMVIGTVRNPVLILDLPSNGYLADQLNRVNVVNHGTAEAETDIVRMEAWGDDGDLLFDPAADDLLGVFQETGDRWELTGLAADIPSGGRRFFITVDIAETAIPAGDAIRLGIPALPDVGVGMASSNDGPLDLALVNPYTQGIKVVDRIILTAEQVPEGLSHPGARDLTLLHLVATNTYTTAQTLQTLVVSNASSGSPAATVADLDGIFHQVVLRLDGDGDGQLGDYSTDPHLADGVFQAGKIDFSGLNLELLPEEPLHLFVTADLDLWHVADGDQASAMVLTSGDVVIPDCALVATWPLDSGSNWMIDGMVADQVQVREIPGLTMAPGDGPALAMDLTIPPNGYMTDQLIGLEIQNFGSATEGDVNSLTLWEDGGNGTFDAGAVDDIDLGALVLSDGLWSSPVLGQAVSSFGLQLFVGLVVSGAPQDSATVELGIPLGGIRMSSDNSGPIDVPLGAQGSIQLSTAPLLTNLSFSRSVITVGEIAQLTMNVRNVGTENILAVTPQLTEQLGDGDVNMGEVAPANLDLILAAQSDFTWDFIATTAGEVVLGGHAEGTGESSGLVRRSHLSLSPSLRIYEPAQQMEVYPVPNLPYSINAGQEDIVPLTLTFVNPGGVDTSPCVVSGLRLLLLEDSTGPPIAPSDLLHRIVVAEGTDVYVDLQVMPTTAGEFTLNFDSWVTVTPNEPVTIGLRFDLKLDTEVPSFLVSLEASTCIVVTDGISGQPVDLILGSGSYPIRSGVGTIVQQATGLSVDVNAWTPIFAGPSQVDVPLAQLALNNNEDGDFSSSVELNRVAFVFRDLLGAPILEPEAYFSQIRLDGPYQNHFTGPVLAVSDSLILLDLSPPLSIPGGALMNLTLSGTIVDEPQLGLVQIVVGAGDLFLARDFNTGTEIPVNLTAAQLCGQVTILEAATELAVGGSGHFPASLALGARDVTALEIFLTHPGPSTEAPIILESLQVEFFDAARHVQDPAPFLDRIRVVVAGQPVGTVIDPAAPDGILTLYIADLVLAPGESDTARIQVDFATNAPTESFEVVQYAAGIAAVDSVRNFPVAVMADDGYTLPISSGITRMIVPPDALAVGAESLMPPKLAPQDEPYEVMRLILTNPAAVGEGSVAVPALTVTQGQDLPTALLLGEAISALEAVVEGEIWSSVPLLNKTTEEAVLSSEEPLVIPAGQSLEVLLRVQISSQAPQGTLTLVISEVGISASIVEDPNTSVHVLPASGQSFPMLTAPGSVTPNTLKESFTNFPNPFAAGRSATTIAYYLPEPAEVSLRILTPHGEVVVSLLHQESRAAGLHQEDSWSGFNGQGVTVRNGVYLAEIVTRFADGSTQRVLRKVAVVR